MWHAISLHLSNAIQQPFMITEKHLIDDSGSSASYRISNGHDNFFLKMTDKIFISMFESEAENLRHLNENSEFSLPKVLYVGTVKDKAVIILEYMSLSPLDVESAFLLGTKLAKLHQQDIQLEYGFDIDNHIGFNEQRNDWHKNWATFFADHRIGFQLQLAKEHNIYFGDIERIVNDIKDRLHGHQPKPSLLHGDFWHGNTGKVNTTPVIFDPACYWGDREVDLANARLFGGFPDAFFEGYAHIWPLPAQHKDREGIYNLYHILNHCLLYGGFYLDETETLLNQLNIDR